MPMSLRIQTLALLTTICGMTGLTSFSAQATEPTARRSSPPTATTEPAPLYPPGKSILSAISLGRSQVGQTDEHKAIVTGVADAFGNGPYDLFLFPNRLFPFKEFDGRGVPYYGPAMITQGSGMNGAVIPGPDGKTLGIFAEGNRVRVCTFNRDTLTFEPYALSEELPLPGGIGIGITGHIDAAHKLNVYFSVSDGVAYRPVGEGDKSTRIPLPFHHLPTYLPYDGAGFWRGGIHRRMLYRARFDSLKMTTLDSIARAGSGPGEFLFEQFGMGIARFGIDRPEVLVSSEHLGNMRAFPLEPETGAVGKPQYLNDSNHVALRHLAITASLRPIADPQSGNTNFIVGDTGRIWFYRFSGQFSPNGSPILLSPEPVMCEHAPLRIGELPVISPGDIDNDGLIDFMAGNDAGQLLFIRNIGRSGRPEFDHPRQVMAGHAPLEIKAGYRGSIQGPAEAMWGYTAPTVCDWNNDGLPDVVLNSVLADYMVLLQHPSAEGVPRFSEPQLLYCDGLQLHLAWRSQPGITDWGGGDRLCMIALDEQNLLRKFWRIDDQNLERGELLTLEDGTSITANIDEAAGQTGRANIVPCDWDGDGRIDVILGTSRGLSFPAGKGIYYPSHYYPKHQASVLLLRNVGTNQAPAFEPVRFVDFNGKPIGLGIHSCSPASINFGNGVRDLYVGEENGTIKYYPHSSLSLSPERE